MRLKQVAFSTQFHKIEFLLDCRFKLVHSLLSAWIYEIFDIDEGGMIKWVTPLGVR